MPISSATAEWLAIVRLACHHAAQSLTEPATQPRSPASRWATRLGLDPFEQLTAWTLVAQQLDRGIAMALDGLCGGPDVTLGGLVAVVYGGDHAGALVQLADDAPLFATGLLRRNAHDADVPWARRVVRASDRLLSIAISDGTASLPARPWMTSARDAAHELCVPTDVIDEVRAALRATGALVIVEGGQGTGKRTMLERLLVERGQTPLTIDARALPTQADLFMVAIQELAAECLLNERVPLVSNLDVLAPEHAERLAGTLSSLIRGNVLASCTRRPSTTWKRPMIAVSMRAPSHAARARHWETVLELGVKEDAERLAVQYPLAPALVIRASDAAKARAIGRDLDAADIYAGIRTVLDGTLGSYARRVVVTQSWDDIVLPPDHTDSVVELLARIRSRHQVYEDWGFAAKVGRGLGVSALFSGPPGTGKTMIAGLIAKELGLELYQVDMAKVVSKYIGETEKNLAAVFDAAEAGHAILLFDEADSLFGKRTDVKSSHDRNANLETNYLLQRLESFTGICILTSNHESNIDPAFQRRLSLHLRFELPSIEERAQLWRAMLPAAAPVAIDIDFSALARRFAMSGGYIRNAALRAAFLASDCKQPITGAMLDRAARVEYEGMGKLAA